MKLWRVRATWLDDQDEATSEWYVNAPTAHEAVGIASTHFRLPPHHVEVRLQAPDDAAAHAEPRLQPGEVRRIVPL